MEMKGSKRIVTAVLVFSLLVAGFGGCSAIDKILGEEVIYDDYAEGGSMAAMPDSSYLGTWYVNESDLTNELTILEIDKDAMTFSLGIERLASIEATARVEGDAIKFTGKDPAGGNLYGTLEFYNRTVLLSIDQAEWEYDLVQTLEFAYHKDAGAAGGLGRYIFDAEYDYTVPQESYTTESGETYFAHDIVVPYVSIDSADAERVNAELKGIFYEAIKYYNEGVSNGLTFVDQCGYNSYLSEDTLSFYVTFLVAGGEASRTSYYAYNFDLKTGRLMTYEEAYKRAGFDEDSIAGEVEWAIGHYMINDLQFNKKMYIDANIKSYKESVEDGSVTYFLDSDNNLNLMLSLSIPVGNGVFDSIITILPEKDAEEEGEDGAAAGE